MLELKQLSKSYAGKPALKEVELQIGAGEIAAVGVLDAGRFGHLHADVGVVGRTTCVPAPVVPRQGLVSGDCTVLQLSNKAVYTHLSATGMVGVPMVVVLVYTQQAIVRSHIAAQIGVVCPGGMHHNTLDGNLATCLVAGILGKNKLNVYFGDKVYQLKGDEHFCALKYVNLYYRYKNKTT